MDDNKQLEEEFLALVSSIGEQIKAKIRIAEQALDEAVDLADKHGIPFYSEVSQIGQSYVPDSFDERFESLDKETVADLLDISEYNLNHMGWRHSQVC